MSMEAVIAVIETESRCTIWHGPEIFLIHSLGFEIVVEDVVSYKEP